MSDDQSLATIPDNIEFTAPKLEKPDKLVLKLTLITLFVFNLLFIYQLVVHYFFPNIKMFYYDIITNIYLCLVVSIASCIMLYRYQRMFKQVELEMDTRLHSEQSLLQIKNILEERMAERILTSKRSIRGLCLKFCSENGFRKNSRKLMITWRRYLITRLMESVLSIDMVISRNGIRLQKISLDTILENFLVNPRLIFM